MDSYSDPSKPRVSEDKEHGAPYRCTVPTNPSIYKASRVILGKVKTWSWQCLLLSSFSVISIATFVYQKRTILFWKWLLGSLLQDYVVHCTVQLYSVHCTECTWKKLFLICTREKYFICFSSIFVFKQAKEKIYFQVQPLKMYFKKILKPCDKKKRQHEDIQFWNWGPATIWHNILYK